MTYDPYEHAASLGLTVLERELPDGLRGLWCGNGVVLIRPGLTYIQHRCVLAHEIVHAQLDQPYFPGFLSPRVEARADRVAASRLIDQRLFLRAVSMFESPVQVAYELDVTPRILRAYRKDDCFEEIIY